MKTIPRWLAATMAFGATAAALHAQSSQQVTVNAIVPVMMNLTVDTNNVVLVFTQGDYRPDGTGSKEAINATTLRVSANARWRLFVSANSSYFSYHAAGAGLNPRKDCRDLSVSPGNFSRYVPVTPSSTEMANGTAGGSDDRGHTIPVSYRLESTLAGDPPGVYTLTITYTLMPR